MKAAGMQVLSDQIEEARPGVVIYGIGDEAHQAETSGHNPDDTPGVSAEDQDADSVPEFRAIDIMIGPALSVEDADRLVAELVGHQENQARLIYVNWWGQQYHRKNNWVPVPYTGKNPHKDHIHASGEADADENIALWNLGDWDGMGELQEMILQNINQCEYYTVNELDPIKFIKNLDKNSPAYGTDTELPNLPLRRAIRIEQKLDKLLARPVEIKLTDEQVVKLGETITAAMNGAVMERMARACEAAAAVLREDA